MTPTIYCADHQHAKVVCSAFAEGCGGKLVPATSRLKPGPAAMWGILRGAGDRIKECELYGHPYFYIDHGYFRRGHYDGYYRVVFCDRHLQGPPQPSDGKRWEALGLEIAPMRRWERRDGVAAYLPISRYVASYLGINAGEFDERSVSALRGRDLAVRICSKEEPGHWEGADLVVGFQSNALIEASLAGYRVQELGASPAGYILDQKRKLAFSWLADNQWTLEEMRSGKCWADLTARYGDQLAEAA